MFVSKRLKTDSGPNTCSPADNLLIGDDMPELKIINQLLQQNHAEKQCNMGYAQSLNLCD